MSSSSISGGTLGTRFPYSSSTFCPVQQAVRLNADKPRGCQLTNERVPGGKPQVQKDSGLA